MCWLVVVLPPVLFRDYNRIKYDPTEMDVLERYKWCTWWLLLQQIARWALLKSIYHLFFSKAEIYLISSGWLTNGDAGLCKLEPRDSWFTLSFPFFFFTCSYSEVQCALHLPPIIWFLQWQLSCYYSFASCHCQSSRFCGYRQSWPCQWSVSVFFFENSEVCL